MSMELHVFLPKLALPDVHRWQAAIDTLGIDVRLDPDVDVETHSGFWPAAFNGQPGGFEFDVAPASDVIEVAPDIAGRVRGLDIVGNFRWGGDLNEMASALTAAAALASISGGVWFDPQEGQCLDATAAVREARSCIADAGD